MIDLRYHIYSLVAVFLSLALGILIGASIVAPGATDSKGVNRSQSQITELERSYDSLRKEIADKQETASALQVRLDQTEQVCRALFPSAVNGLLSYRNVAIIQTGGSDEAVAAARTALEQAGAKVNCSIRLNDKLVKDGDSVSEAAIEAGFNSDTDDSAKLNALLTVLTDSIVWAKSTDKLDILEKHNLVSVSGDMTHWNKTIVIVGGANSKPHNHARALDMPLIEALQNKGVEPVGCEAYDVKISYIGAYAGKGISTVDCIDKAAGQIGLVYALTGEHGHFGAKKTADRLIPRTLRGAN
ncbi:MAG: copper transporter [Armatimonadota bacterium]|nr:copper transporter [Armatimonadota bacterium]